MIQERWFDESWAIETLGSLLVVGPWIPTGVCWVLPRCDSSNYVLWSVFGSAIGVVAVIVLLVRTALIAEQRDKSRKETE